MLYFLLILFIAAMLWMYWGLRNLRSMDDQNLPGGRIRLRVEAFTGFGRPDLYQVAGRVSKDGGRFTALDSEFERMKWGGKFRRNLRRFLLPDMEGVQVDLKVEGVHHLVTTNAYGRFFLRVEDRPRLLPGATTYTAQIPETQTRFIAEKSVGQILVPTSEATFGVISDVDDTIVATNVQNTFRMILHTAFSSVSDLRPTPGYPALLTAAHQGKKGHESNPIFYVTGSPINIRDKTHAFLRANRFPIGPIFMTSIGRNPEAGFFTQRSYKTDRIREIFDMYPKLKFVLMGDNSQLDSEIYQQVNKEFPRRVLATLIYEVIPHIESGKILPLGQHRIAGALEGGKVLYRLGLISTEGLRSIANELIAEDFLPDSFKIDRLIRQLDQEKKKKRRQSK